MERSEHIWRKATQEARDFLRRYDDTWTRSHLEDFAQEALLAAWSWSGQVRHPERLWAAIHTIARRIRGRARRSPAWLTLPRVDAVPCCAEPRREHAYRIAGRAVPVSRVGPWLDQALRRLPPVDRDLLLGFYEGFCCSELAERFRRSLPCVKTRIHRARVRVQRTVEACARTAHDLDD